MPRSDGSVIIRSVFSTKGIQVGVQSAKKMCDAFVTHVRKISAEVDKAISTNASIGGKQQREALSAATKAYNEQLAKVQELRKAIDASRTANATDEFKAITAQIEKVERDLNRAIEQKERFLSTGGKENSKQFLKYQYDIENITRVLREAQAERDALIDDGKAYTSPVDTSELQEAEQKLSRLRAALDASQGAVDSSSARWRLLAAALKGVSAAGKTSVNLFKKIAGVMGKAAKKVASFLNPFKKTNKGFSGGFKSILRYAFGIRSLFVLFNRLRSAIKEGFENLAQFSVETNASISQISSALTRLKNSLATAFAPILDVIAPILTRLIDYLSEAATRVGMLIAALTGQKQFTKAIAVQEDYAESLKKTADATKNLSGLDEIRTFNDGSSNAEAGKATPEQMFETVEIPDMFTNLAQRIKEALSKVDLTAFGASIAQKISDALNNIPWEDIQSKCSQIAYSIATFINGSLGTPTLWTSVAATISQGLNTAVQTALTLLTNIDWLSVGSSIASGLNTAVSTIDWKSIGLLLASYFMMVINLLLGAVTTFDWGALGDALAEGVNNVISAVNWTALGVLFTEGMLGIIRLLRSAITGVNWHALGADLAEGLNSVDWVSIFEDLAGLLSDGLLAIGDAIIGFAEHLDWEKLGRDLFDSISGIIENIDWGGIVARIFRLLGDAVGGAAALIGGFVQEAWEAIIDGFKSTGEYFNEKIEEMGGNVVLGILKGIVDGIAGIAEWIDEHIFQPFLDGLLGAFGIHSPAKTMEDPGKNILLGMLEGMKTGFIAVIDWLLYIPRRIGEIFGDVIETVKAIAKGDWKSAWESFKKIFSDIWDTLVNVVKTPINLVIGLINGMLDGIEKGVNYIIDAVNKLSFKVPDWVPAIGGKDFGFNLKRVTISDIPYLAKGAVIPPNAPFAAVLGDQRRGTNIEAPLDTIKDAVREVLVESNSGGENVYRFTAQIGRRVLFDEVITEARMRQSANGRNPFALA